MIIWRTGYLIIGRSIGSQRSNARQRACGLISPTLYDAPLGARVRLREISGDRELRRRLLALGLPRLATVTVLHRNGGGVVVISQSNRVAIGASIAADVFVDILPGDAS